MIAHFLQAEAVDVEVLITGGDAIFGEFVSLVVVALALVKYQF